MERNVPKIEWATEIITQTAPAPQPPSPPTDAVEISTLLDPLDAAPLLKAGITTVGRARAVEDLTEIKGIGAGRATKINNILRLGAAPASESLAPPDYHPFEGAFADAFKAIDTALEISKSALVLSSNYPRIVEQDGRKYIVIRWGLCPRYQYFTTALHNADPRFHACPPLSRNDTGMVECWKAP